MAHRPLRNRVVAVRIETRHHLEHPRDEVNAWLERPGAPTWLTPPGLALAPRTPPRAAPGSAASSACARPGAVWQPLRPADAAPRRAEPPFDFADQQVRGPWRTRRHEHAVEESGSGAAVHDRLEVEAAAHLERWEPRRGAGADVLHSPPASCARTSPSTRRGSWRPLTVAIAGSSAYQRPAGGAAQTAVTPSGRWCGARRDGAG